MQTMPLFAALDLPQWLPDEIFYSLACRYHVLSCNGNFKATLSQLFGQPQLGYQHDFPSGLNLFVNRTNATLGSAAEIIRQRTLLPFYLPMRDPHHAREIESAFAAGDIASLKYKLGILTSRFRANHPLKACTQCMNEDMARYSVKYWHRCHQFPGVWICPTHLTVLYEANVKANGVGRFQFYLPSDTMLQPLPAWGAGDKDQQFIGQLMNMAKCSMAMASLPAQFHFSATTLHDTYIAACDQLGLITKNGSVRLKEAVQQFAKHAAPLSVVPELDLQRHDAADLYTQLGRILRAPRTGTHPLRHILLLTWLFGTWEQFFSAYQSQANTTNVVKNSQQNFFVREDPLQEQIPRAMLSLIQKGSSATSAAHELGIDISTGMAILAKNGIANRRRPKLLHGALLNAVIADIRSGDDIQGIATIRGVSVSAIYRTKNSTVGLHEAWMDARASFYKAAMRQAWTTALSEYPNLGIKLLRSHTPAAYMWLYRHDREWLHNNSPALAQANTERASAVRWDERDVALSQKVNEVILQLHKSVDRHPIHLWQIYQHIPELKAKLGVLDRLPRTKKVLEDAIYLHLRPPPGNLFME